MPTQLEVFVDSEFGVKWREQYVSEGINAKLAVALPPGVYRGFRLTTDAGNQTVKVLSDPDVSDHVAVYLTDDGYSLTVRRTGGDFVLDLSAFANKTVVVAIYVEYVTFTTTTAEIRGYELSPSDEFTGATEVSELVVLGTVVVPAAAIPIPASDISDARRDGAWAAVAKEAQPWVPVVRNSGFEFGYKATHGTANIPYYDIDHWECWPLDSNGDLYRQTTVKNSGEAALAFEYLVGATTTSLIARQYVGVACPAGTRIRYRFWVRVFTALAGGDMYFQLYTYNAVGLAVFAGLIVIDGTSVDSSFRVIEGVFEIPAGHLGLAWVEFNADSIEAAAAPSVILYMDDLQVWIEREGSLSGQRDERLRGQAVLSSLLLNDYLADFSDEGALVRFDKDSPASQGTIYVERKDSDQTGARPVLDIEDLVADHQVSAGAGLIGTVADAVLPRFIASIRDATTGFTLVMEFGRARLYYYENSSNNSSRWVMTYNARWQTGSSTWTYDNNARPAAKFDLGDLTTASEAGFYLYWKDFAQADWNDSSWDALILSAVSAGGGVPKMDADDFNLTISNVSAGVTGSNPPATTALQNELRASNIAKAWGIFRVTAGGDVTAVDDGFCVTSISRNIASNYYTITLAGDMDDANFAVAAKAWDPTSLGSWRDVVIGGKVVGPPTSFRLYPVEEVGGTIQAVDIDDAGTDITIEFTVFGKQTT